MIIKIKKNSSYVLILLYMIFLFSKIQTRLAVPLFDDNYIILGYCAVITLALAIAMLRYRTSINKRFLFLLLLILVYTVIFSTVFYNDALSKYINSYFFAFTSFIVFEFFTAYYFCIKNSMLVFIKWTYVIISGFLLVCYALYFDNFATILHLSEYFSLNRTRSSFGFTQENTTAEICLSALVCSFILLIANKDKKIQLIKMNLRYLQISSLIIIVMIISTSSRGALLAVISMVITYYYLNLSEKQKRTTNRIIFKSIIFIVCVSSSIIVYSKLISSGKFDIEYRLMNFTMNIPLLISEGKLWSGMGFVEKSIFSRGLIIAGSGYTDNYYLYVLVSTGIIGCSFVGLFVIKLWRYIVKQAMVYNNSKISRVIKSIFVMVLVFAMTQSTLLSPVSILSIVTLFIFIAYVVRGDGILE